MRWQLVVTRTDGQTFGPGTYVVHSSAGQFLDSLRFEDGRPWVGRAKRDDTRTIVVRDIATREDLIKFHDREGNVHLGRGNAAEAIPPLEALTRLVPERWQPHAALGAA